MLMEYNIIILYSIILVYLLWISSMVIPHHLYTSYHNCTYSSALVMHMWSNTGRGCPDPWYQHGPLLAHNQYMCLTPLKQWGMRWSWQWTACPASHQAYVGLVPQAGPCHGARPRSWGVTCGFIVGGNSPNCMHPLISLGSLIQHVMCTSMCHMTLLPW